MAINLLLLMNSFGTIFFFLLFMIAIYLYLTKKNDIALFMGASFLFFTIREITYLLSDAFGTDPALKVVGGAMSFIAALIYLYVFFMEEESTKNMKRIAKAFRV